MPVGQWLGSALGIALAASSLLWARSLGLGGDELGLRRRGALPSAAAGAALALLAALTGLIVLRFPPLVGGPIVYAPLVAIGGADLQLRAFVTMPLDTVVPEELAFRGVLLALLRRRHAVVPSLVLSTVPFALWHGWIAVSTVRETNLSADPLLFALGLSGAFVAIFAGGIAFAALRAITGNLAAPLAAHWTFNTVLLFGLRLSSGL